MNSKQIIKNIIISIIIGILLGIITEYALILNLSWLIQITQSFLFWGLIICITAFVSKDFCLSIINPIIVICLMNITYYLIRLFMSGYTNLGGLDLYTFTGIAGAIYIGTIIYVIKNKFLYHKGKCFPQILYLIIMTIIGIIFTKIGYSFPINHNLTYNIDLGIIIGFILSIILVKILKKDVVNQN